jgi:hypothetical protein
MKRSSFLVLLFASCTSSSVQAQQVVISDLSHPVSYNNVSIVNTVTHTNTFATSISGNGVTGTLVTSGTLAGKTGDPFTVSGSNSCFDGAQTIATAKNEYPYTYTFNSACDASYTVVGTNDQDVVLIPFHGQTYAFYRQGTTDSHDPGVIMQMTSKDGGPLQNPLELFADNSGQCNGGTENCDYRAIEAGTAANGDIVMMWLRYDWNPIAALDVLYTTYDGKSWSEPRKVTAVPPGRRDEGWRGCPSDGPTFRLPGGALGAVLTGNGDGFCTDKMFIFVSCDDGLTWGTGKECTGQAARFAERPIIPVRSKEFRGMPTNEAVFLWIGGETLIGFERNNQWTDGCTLPCGPLLFLATTDMGKTWKVTPTNFSLTPLPSGQTNIIYSQVSPWLFSSHIGNFVTLLFAERQSNSAVQYRGYLRAVIFDPWKAFLNPQGFDQGQIIWSNTFPDWGYPTAAFYGENRLIFGWDSQNYIAPNWPLNLFTMTGTYALSDSPEK